MAAPTKLGRIVNQAPADATKPRTKLAELVNGRRGMAVELPGIGAAYIEILGNQAAQDVEAEVHRNMKARAIESSMLTYERFEAEKAFLTLLRAVRDPDNHEQPLGTRDDWAKLDDDRLFLAWQAYGDVREQLNPADIGLSDDERLAIEVAAKKNDDRLLRSYGVAKLSACMRSMAARPSTSPTPSSSSSGSPTD